MRRRYFVKATAVSAMTWPLVVRAQSERVRRADWRAGYAACVEALQQLGWTDGRNVQIRNSVGLRSIFFQVMSYDFIFPDDAHGTFPLLTYEKASGLRSDGGLNDVLQFGSIM